MALNTLLQSPPQNPRKHRFQKLLENCKRSEGSAATIQVLETCSCLMSRDTERFLAGASAQLKFHRSEHTQLAAARGAPNTDLCLTSSAIILLDQV